MAKHFQYKVEVFFKKIMSDGPLGKIKCYAFRIEFQKKSSPHVRSFTWVLKASNIESEAANIGFVEKTTFARPFE